MSKGPEIADLAKKIIHLLEKQNFRKDKIAICVRSGENLASIQGILVGWNDPPLTLIGKQQANTLLPTFYKHLDRFRGGIHCSDLIRSYRFADIAVGFAADRLVNSDTRLREINFGNDEGYNYDSMTQADKERIDCPEYSAVNGESWADVRARTEEFFSEHQIGVSLNFTHGGLICSHTYGLGLTDIMPHASVVALKIGKNGVAEDLVFEWEYPLEEVV